MVFILASALIAQPLHAHIFKIKTVYVPPMPFWMYLYGGALVLILSFLITLFFLRSDHGKPQLLEPRFKLLPRLAIGSIRFLSFITLALLMVCIYFGWYGPNEPGQASKNLGMTLFWIVFVLGGVYVMVIAGNFYQLINPWQTLSRICLWPLSTAKRQTWQLLPYPSWLGYWPALLFYMGFIWLELLGNLTPSGLANWLLIYSAINLVGAFVFGVKSWFRYAEFFAVFFRLIGMMAPIQWRREPSSKRWAMSWRWPMQGLFRATEMLDNSSASRNWSLILFILFMLSSTVFDGLHETTLWNDFYRTEMYEWVFKNWLTGNIYKDNASLILNRGYWQTLCLMISPFAYLLIYCMFMRLSGFIGSSTLKFHQLAYYFALSLLPIALVYNLSHYFVLLYAQGVKLFPILSDPFLAGSDWFGTKHWFYGDQGFTSDTVWHTQVFLIVIGHVTSVVVAHKMALQVFKNSSRAVLSQIPMLLLMVIFTVAGLWVLTLPLKGG